MRTSVSPRDRCHKESSSKSNAIKLFQQILSLVLQTRRSLMPTNYFSLFSPYTKKGTSAQPKNYFCKCCLLEEGSTTCNANKLFQQILLTPFSSCSLKKHSSVFFYGELTPFWCLPNTRCCHSPRMNFTFTILASSTIFWWDHGFAPLHTEAHCLAIQPNLVSVNYDAMDTDYCVVLTSVVRTTGL